MSYDYNALVESIVAHRKQAADAEDPATHLQHAVDTFATLSSHCPMTPLLWMQYAYDTWQLMKALLPDQPQQAAEMRLQTLELGLAEFPGCALLQLHYLQLLMMRDAAVDDTKAAFQQAISNVGLGSHRNEGELVAAMYRLYAKYLVSKKKPIIDVFVQRAETPMKDANDGLTDEFHQFCQQHGISVTPDDLQRIEKARRWSAKTFGGLMALEDDVDVAMNAEGILMRSESYDDMDWEPLLKSESRRSWMGLGGAQTATAFAKYAQACSRYSAPRQDDTVDAQNEDAANQEERVHALALAVYERGVSECPTAESLWLSYLRHLLYLITTKHALASASRLKSVASRAVRNCPYSLQLLQKQMNASLVSAEAGTEVFDPSPLNKIVEGAIKSKFLPNPQSQLDLYMTAIRTVKRRIMSILTDGSGKYDGAEPNSETAEKEEALEEAADQEVQDLVEDIREMYEDVDTFLRKNHASFSDGRVFLWKDRAMSESCLLEPLMASLESSGERSTGEGIRCFDKLVKVKQPPHPDGYAAYIRAILNQHVTSPKQVLRNIQTARSLYQKALKSIGKPKDKTESIASLRDRTTALQSLCYDYLEFEQVFGSDESYVQASRNVRKKLESLVLNGTQHEQGTPNTSTEAAAEPKTGSKRKHSEDAAVEPSAKKPKAIVSGEDVPMKEESAPDQDNKEVAAPTPAPLPGKKKAAVPKVRVGKLDYPAHPFTVRVTNLAKETEDMDLVDAFRPKCGTVVHAKIVREKHHPHQAKGRSKGWGLVQFEERESVDKALALNDVIGIHERVVKVDRSHVPAVGLVPPGMHRVNPKGEGKSSKRNLKKRERKMSHGEEAPKGDEGDAGKGEQDAKKQAASSAKTGSAGILAFRPRGVAHGSAHRKVKLSLGKDKAEG